jgi:hypothetical protein
MHLPLLWHFLRRAKHLEITAEKLKYQWPPFSSEILMAGGVKLFSGQKLNNAHGLIG